MNITLKILLIVIGSIVSFGLIIYLILLIYGIISNSYILFTSKKKKPYADFSLPFLSFFVEDKEMLIEAYSVYILTRYYYRYMNNKKYTDSFVRLIEKNLHKDIVNGKFANEKDIEAYLFHEIEKII